MIIGEPRVYPRYGDLAGAWAQGNISEDEFVVVCFHAVLPVWFFSVLAWFWWKFDLISLHNPLT